MSDVKKIFSKNIRKITSEKGIKQNQIAKVLHVSRPTVCNWYRGTHVPDMALAVKLAEYIGCSLDYLFRGGGEPQRITEDTNSKEIIYRVAVSDLKKDNEFLKAQVKECREENQRLEKICHNMEMENDGLEDRARISLAINTLREFGATIIFSPK